jgi:hypothetical protein
MSETNDDFQTVDHSGGKITFHFEDRDGRREFHVSFHHQSGGVSALFAVYAVVPDGIPVATIKMGGIGLPWALPPFSQCVPVFIGSDLEGFFGRYCPRCTKYFRTDSLPVDLSMFCAYCGYTSPVHEFLTKAHLRYIRSYVDAFLRGDETGTDVTIDLDALAVDSETDRSPLYYTEEKQQTRFQCRKCRARLDIFGQYGFCSSCGQRNTFAVFDEFLSRLRDRVTNPRYPDSERAARDGEWREITKQCVSHFEGFGRDLVEILARFPATPSRTKSVRDIPFHNPLKAADDLKKFFEIDLLVGLDLKQQDFIRKRFLRRHLYEHTSGVVDEEYVRLSGENHLRIGQVLRESRSNVATLIDLCRTMAKNFDEEFGSMNLLSKMPR